MLHLINNLRYVFFKKGMLPVYLIFGVTYRCNSRCETCFNWRYVDDPEAIKRELTLREIEKISSSLNRIGWLLFTGGEPFLRNDLDQIAEVFYGGNGVRNITIPTNGLLTARIVEKTGQILDCCPEARVTVSLALDGVGDLHDEIRGAPGNFRSLMKTYQGLVNSKKGRRNLSINLNTVVFSKNIEGIKRLIHHARNNMSEADFHTFELLRGQPRNPDLRALRPEEFAKVLEMIKEHWKGFGFSDMPLTKFINAAKILARDLELETLRQRRQVIPCYAGQISGVIDPYGDVRLCELLPPVGNLKDAHMDFPAVWFSEKAEYLRKSIRRGECFCTHSCFLSSSLLFNPRQYPRLLWYAVRF